MKQKILVDVKIECEPPSYIYTRWKNITDMVIEIEKWVKEFHDFIRDHRSQDPVNLNIEKIYEEQCSYCKSIWDEDEDGIPLCCDKAQQEIEHKIEIPKD